MTKQEKYKLDEDTWGAFQLMSTAGLIDMASGRVDANAVILEELAARGWKVDDLSEQQEERARVRDQNRRIPEPKPYGLA